jgi:two-component system sensor histidine kinase MtrB
VAVLVRDHGLGLRPGEAGLVFNRFWRADSSRARRSGGTGLGLSISLEDARLHGGWLQAWGEPGRGAAFRLTLPRTVGGELDGSPLTLVPTDEPLDSVLVHSTESGTGPAALEAGTAASGAVEDEAGDAGDSPAGAANGSSDQVTSAGIREQR